MTTSITSGKVVLVTGASSGIGAAICVNLARAGYVVYGVSRRGTVPDVAGECANVHPCIADVNSEQALAAVVQRIQMEQGRLDAVVCNAGSGVAGPIEECSSDEIAFQMGTTFMGTVNTIKACMPVFRAQKQGRIITVSSVAAVAPLPFQGYYSCAKASILQLTKALAIEAGPFGVQTCCILPGDVKTGFTGARRVCEITSTEASPYHDACRQAVQCMADDEQVEGMEPEVIARAVARQLTLRRMRPEVVPSLKYKLLVCLIRLLPERLVLRVIGWMYR